MKVILDIRVLEEWAQREFGSSLGQPLRSAPLTGDKDLDAEVDRLLPPLTRRIVLDAEDPRFDAFKTRLLRDEKHRPGIRGAILVRRDYAEQELARAKLFQLIVIAVFEPSGEDMGTEYDDRDACPTCGAGRVQRSPLRLDLSKVPKSVDIAVTINPHELIISQRLVELMASNEITGYQLQPVEHRGKGRIEVPWYQLFITGKVGPTMRPTQFGEDYLHPDQPGSNVCSAHSLTGLKLISEVFIHREFLDHVDLGPIRITRFRL